MVFVILPRKQVHVSCDLPISLSYFSFIKRRSFGRLSIQYIRYLQCIPYGIRHVVVGQVPRMLLYLLSVTRPVTQLSPWLVQPGEHKTKNANNTTTIRRSPDSMVHSHPGLDFHAPYPALAGHCRQTKKPIYFEH